MQRTTVIQQEWWDLRAEATWGNTQAGQDVVALRAENDQLRRALASRAVIDQARGMVMALAPCSSERAWDVLVDVSQHCNIKLRDVAVALVVTTNDRTLPEPIQRELRRALRGLHLADRTSTDVATRHRRDPP
ncbi:ANTAR domain-containing protein [Streptomyces sp. NBC_01352]|uniref:ANTAR domain-containing protein n=1 Tax=unclassified Streptomyces TaxID=2593676 RepID=UPI00225B8561|nr:MULTISPECIES: ANTAR domain-containing protein [unclassified Streptomyces]MCX4700023.1 ANTAR domain-containing protein [Streptomyces sp. NBC_01373]